MIKRIDMFKQESRNHLNVNKKLEIYNLIKHNHSMEPYLIDVNNTAHRIAVSKMCLSAHKFPIEVGRYVKTQRKKRTCNLCKSKSVADELHYCMYCNHKNFENLRTIF